ncbi:MAG: hypothetical protein DMG61_12660 [Acidobacteria bacterium]|nr:MAG: hypothetical protein DMG61_12660 [Acidobacteriota bacterium]
MNEYAKQYVARLRNGRGETVTGGELMELQQAAPLLWSESRKWLQSTSYEINRCKKSDTLDFELGGQEEVRVLRKLPVTRRLHVRFRTMSERIEYTCGAAKGEYMCGIGEDRRPVLTDVYHTMISTSALRKTLLEILYASQCPTVRTASRPHYV